MHMRPPESPSVCGHLPAMKSVRLSARHVTTPLSEPSCVL